MADIAEIRARVAEIAATWLEADATRGPAFVDELRGYNAQVETDDHPDAPELSGQIYQLIENIENMDGVPNSDPPDAM